MSPTYRNVLAPTLCAVLLAATSPCAMADAVASSTGRLDVQSDASNYVWARATGINKVHVNAKGNAAAAVVDPPVAGAAAANIVVGLAAIAGLGVTATKPTGIPAPSFTNTATAGGTTSTGTGTFTYVTGVVLDTATYTASANVTAPVARGVRFAGPDVAWASAEDPINFNVPSSSSLSFGATLSNVSMTGTEGGDNVFSAFYSLDGVPIFSLLIDVPTNIVSPSQATITFSSARGEPFDTNQVNALRGALSVGSPGTLSLGGTFNLYPQIQIPLTVGDHELAGGISTVSSLVPEPAAGGLLAGAVCLFGGRRKRATAK